MVGLALLPKHRPWHPPRLSSLNPQHAAPAALWLAPFTHTACLQLVVSNGLCKASFGKPLLVYKLSFLVLRCRVAGCQACSPLCGDGGIGAAAALQLVRSDLNVKPFLRAKGEDAYVSSCNAHLRIRVPMSGWLQKVGGSFMIKDALVCHNPLHNSGPYVGTSGL